MPTKKETVQTLRCQNSKVKVVAVVVLHRLFSVSCKMSLFSNSKFKSSFKVVVRMPTNTMTGTWEDLSCPNNSPSSPGANLGGRCRGCAPPSPPPEMTCGFLIQLVFCEKKKTMWFVGVEVEQETSASPPKNNPGSAPAALHFL